MKKDGTLTTRDAVRLFHEGQLVLADVQHHGIKVDVSYLKAKLAETTSQIDDLECSIQSDKIWRTWRRTFGRKAKLGSKEQLAHVLFKVMGLPCYEYTAKSYEADGAIKEDARPKADETAILKTKLPFARDYIKCEKLKKLRSTYLEGTLREVQDGYLHPMYNLNIVTSFRSSCSLTNFQNVPARNPEISEIIRRCYIPSGSKWSLGEADFAGIEVRVAYCYHKDPTMRNYLLDPASDMHRDQASDLFFMPIDFLVANKDWAKKRVRDWAKNRWVFPQFYGSVYFQCAPSIWEAVLDGHNRKDKVPGTNLTIKKWLKQHGIKELGDCSQSNRHPAEDSFVRHCQKCERKMWDVRFPQYTQWKKDWWNAYLKKGYYETLTGFIVRGVYKRNEVLNYGIQGSAFHCLLWSLIQLNKWLKKYKMKSRIVGEIHDSMLLDLHPKEIHDVLNQAYKIMTVDLLKAWKWISIPMESETEVSPPGASWHEKKVWVATNGVWEPK